MYLFQKQTGTLYFSSSSLSFYTQSDMASSDSFLCRWQSDGRTVESDRMKLGILTIIGFHSLRMGFEQTCDRLRLFRFGLWRYFCLIYKTTEVFLLSCRFQSEKKPQKPIKQQYFLPKVVVTQLFWKSELLWAVSSLHGSAEIGCHPLTSERLVKGANLASELLRGTCHSHLNVTWNTLKQQRQTELDLRIDSSVKYKDAN